MSKVNRASLQSLCYFKWPCVKVGLRVLLSLILTVWCQAGQSSEFSTETSAAAAAASSRLQSPASECLQEGQQIIFLFVTHISYSIQWTVHLVRIYWVNHLYTIKGKNSKPHPSVFNHTDVRLDWCSTRLIQYQSSEVPDWSSTSLGGAVPDWSSLCAHVWPKSVFLLRSCSSFRRRRTRRSCVCVRESKILRRTSESVRVDWRGRGTRSCCLVLAVWVKPTGFICFTVYTFTLTLSVQLRFLLSALGSCV